MLKTHLVRILLCLITLTSLGIADDADMLDVNLVIEGHKFYPEIIEVPTGRKIRLIVENKDDSVEEFDSVDLRREKIIPGGTSVHIVLRTLKEGKYEFVGEFHPDTAKGYIIAK